MAGETGGALPEVLDRLASLLESEEEIKKGVKSAVRYPMIAIVVLIIAFLILTTMVVPKFAQVYTRMQMKLPLPTKVMIALSNGLNNYYYIVFPVLAGAIFVWELRRSARHERQERSASASPVASEGGRRATSLEP